MSLRPHTAPQRWRLVRRIGLAMAALLWLGCPPGPEQEDRLAEWGLPSDLHDHLDDLQVLRLSGEIDGLAWLAGASSLQRLELDAVATGSLPALGDGLIELRVERTALRRPLRWPVSLRRLELRSTGIAAVVDLPELVHLRLEGGGPASLDGLPDSLRSAELVDLRLPIIGPTLPNGLRRLEVVGSGAVTLDSLDRLVALTLRRTEVTSLSDLPAGLESLHLESNEGLALGSGSLPALLSALTLDGHGIAAGDLPRELETLVLIDSRIEDAELLPRDLRRLVLQTPLAVEAAIAACPDLGELTLEGRHLGDGGLPDFTKLTRLTNLKVIDPPPDPTYPPELAELTLVAPRDLRMPGVGSGLKRLTVRTPTEPLCAADVAALADRFPALEHLALTDARIVGPPRLSGFTRLAELDLSSSRLVERPADWPDGVCAPPRPPPDRLELPPNLGSLVVADSMLGVLRAAPLRSLTRLDVSNSGVTFDALPDELPRLTDLTVHGGQLPEIGSRFPALSSLSIVVDRSPDRPGS